MEKLFPSNLAHLHSEDHANSAQNVGSANNESLNTEADNSAINSIPQRVEKFASDYRN